MKTLSIYYSVGDAYEILLENSRFLLNSDALGRFGGNIYISGRMNFVQSKVCCMNCSSNSQGMHSFVTLSPDLYKLNIVQQCSFVQLIGSKGMGILHNTHGIRDFNQINISNSNNEKFSCIYVQGIKSDSTIRSSNFNNNTSNNDGSIYLNNVEYDKTVTYNLKSCNIIDQSCYGNSGGIITILGSLKIDSCVIKDNNASTCYLFYSFRDLIIYISNSYINNPLMNSFANYPSSISETNSKSNENDIKNYFNINSNCKERKYLQINLAEYETFVRDKGISISFYLSSVYLATLYAQS